MRVVTRARRDERGAVAVIVALCAVMLFGFAAYAVDAGQVWETRRNMVTASDAAALAAAGSKAEGSTDAEACAEADTYLGENVDDASRVTCNPHGAGTDAGYVTVQGETTAKHSFAPIFGNDDDPVRATTTAEWGIPKSVSGLRPFGLCLYQPDLYAWLNLPNGPSGPLGQKTITYNKANNVAPCGNLPGNWGVLDFDGGPNPMGTGDGNCNNINGTRDWVRCGYPGEVDIPQDIPGDPGAFSNSLDTELNYLKGKSFALPVFDNGVANGNNASFHVVAVVYVTLVDFQSNQSPNERSLTLRFDRGVVEGTCCSNTGLDTGARAVRICDVDDLSPDTSDPERAC